MNINKNYIETYETGTIHLLSYKTSTIFFFVLRLADEVFDEKKNTFCDCSVRIEEGDQNIAHTQQTYNGNVFSLFLIFIPEYDV